MDMNILINFCRKTVYVNVISLYFMCRVVLRIRKKLIARHLTKLEQSKNKRIDLDNEALRWSPLAVTGLAILEEEREAKREVRHNVQLAFDPTFRQLRARRALTLFNDVPLRTRRALSPYTLYSNSALLVLNGTSL